MKFKSDIEVQAGLKDSSGSVGTSGQVLSTTATGVSWINVGVGGYVPYTGATANVDLGAYALLASDLIINHASGSGIAASITKGGNGEALTVVKTSGSGNAASITGGITLLTTLNLTNALADTYISSASNWNAAYNDKINSASVTGTTTKTLTLNQQDGGTITASWTESGGGVTSFNTRTGAVTLTSGDVTTALGYTPVTSARTLTINGVSYDLSADRSWTVSGGIGGSGTTNYIPKFTASTTVGNSSLYDNGNIGFGTTSPNGLWSGSNKTLQITGGTNIASELVQSRPSATISRFLSGTSSTFGVYTADALNYEIYTSGSQRLSVNSSGNVIASVDSRAPIFYDSNNTGYYVDPASTSTLYDLNIAGQQRFTTQGAKVYFGDNTVGSPLCIGEGLIDTFGSDSDFMTLYGRNSIRFFTPGTSEKGRFDTDGFKATIMYDLNNTANYLDPNGTSNLYIMKTSEYRGNANVGGTGEATWHPAGIYCGSTMWQYGAMYKNNTDIHDINIGYANSSLRAPIFYDNNNTGYYLDPASGSNLNAVYADNWFRTYGQTGLYSQTYGIHFAPVSGAAWQITGSGGNIELQFRSNHNSTIRGYVYADTSNNIGFLNNGGGWALRTDSSNNAQVFGTTLTVNAGGSGSSYIDMNDGDEGSRSIHCNSNRIGFLTQGGSWGSYCTDNGDWVTDMISWAGASMRAPIFYDSNNTGYYLDPASTSNLNVVQAAGGFFATSDERTKENIVTIDNALDKVNALRGVYYNQKNSEYKKDSMGVIAQEVMEVVPEVVGQGSNGMYNVAYGNLAGLFIEAIKEQQKQIEELKELVNKLTNK